MRSVVYRMSGCDAERRTVGRLYDGDGYAVARNGQTLSTKRRHDRRSVAHRKSAAHRWGEGEDDCGELPLLTLDHTVALNLTTPQHPIMQNNRPKLTSLHLLRA